MLTLVLAAFLFDSPGPGSDSARQPFDCVSVNGAWTVHVEPSARDGSGPMNCRLSHGKEVAWERQLPWTFEAAGVANDGTLVGYANQKTLRIVVLDAHGDLRKQTDIEHTSAIVDGPSLPVASGPVLILDSAGLAYVRVYPGYQSRPSPWRTISLSTGELTGEVRPEVPGPTDEHHYVYERDARIVGDTGLILCQWWTCDSRPANLGWWMDGAVFELVDASGKSVWTLPWLDDYTDRTSERADNLLEQRIRWRSPILSTGAGGAFSLWSVRSDERVDFVAQPDAAAANGWSVCEVERKPIVRKVVPAAELLELEPLGRVSLAAPASADGSPIRDVLEIGFTEAGEIEIMRMARPGSLSYARLRPNGKLVFEHDFSELTKDREGWPECFDLEGDRWLLRFDAAEPPWIELDVKTGAVKPCPLPAGGLDTSIAPAPDGGYLALVPQIIRMTGVTELLYVTPDGSIVWRETVSGIGADSSELEQAVFFASGLARTAERSFALLGSDALTWIDLDRHVLRSVPLEEVLGHEAGYVCSMRPDHQGGVYFSEGHGFAHMNAQLKLAGSVVPRLTDGSPDSALERHFRVAPNGRLWTSDGARLYRLRSSGDADLELGPRRIEGELREEVDAAIDAHGRILVRDRFSQALHAFSDTGAPLFVFKVASKERSNDSFFESFHSLPDGSIWMEVAKGILHISPKGERLGETRQEEGYSMQSFLRGQMSQLDPDELAFERVERRADGRWLTGRDGRVVLPDKRLALIADAADDSLEDEAALYLFSPEGAPLSAIALPKSSDYGKLSASERWIVAGEYGPKWTLIRLRDSKVFRFEPDLSADSSWYFGQTRDGRTLLLFDCTRLELRRFVLP